MLIEIAIGDAYGAGFEYADASVVRAKNNLSRYVQHPRHGLKPGAYTDDTQMSLAIAEAMLEDLRWGREFIAEKFVEAFHRDPREGYARGFYDFLQGVDSGAAFLERIRPDSDKSGAAMRATPIGLYPGVREVIKRCTAQAKLTHDTIDGTNAGVAAALLAHYCAYDLGPLAEAGRFIASNVAGPWEAEWVGKVGPKGWMSVRAAITAVCRGGSLSGMLRECVAFTGDVDTVAAVAMGAASVSPQVEQDLPAVLYDQLEDGPYGRRYIERLDAELLGRFGFSPRRGESP